MASVGAGEWRVCHSDGGGGGLPALLPQCLLQRRNPLRAEPHPGLGLPEATAEPLASFSNGTAAAGGLRHGKRASSSLEGTGPRESKGPSRPGPALHPGNLPAHGPGDAEGQGMREHVYWAFPGCLSSDGEEGGEGCGRTLHLLPCPQTQPAFGTL